MPTGYTAAVKDGITFEQYAWGCARAFGALIMMRDDPSDAQIPPRFEPSDYYEKALAKDRARLAELMAMSQEQAAAAARLERERELAQHRQWEADKTELRAKYEAMLASALAWEPPSDEHVKFKEFMVQQLRESIEWDCSPYPLPPEKEAGEWLAHALSATRRSIVRSADEMAKEIQRTEGRNEWISALRKSIGEPA